MTQNVELRKQKGKPSIAQVATLEAELAEKQRQISELQEQLSLVKSDAGDTPKLAMAGEDLPAAAREASDAAEALKHQVCFESAVGPCTWLLLDTLCALEGSLGLISVRDKACACSTYVKSLCMPDKATVPYLLVTTWAPRG